MPDVDTSLQVPDFPACTPSEVFDRGLDFRNKFTFAAGEQIVSAVWTVSVQSGEDATPADRIVADAVSIFPSPLAPNGPDVATGCRFRNMLADVDYVLKAAVTTNRGQLLELWGVQSCVRSPGSG